MVYDFKEGSRFNGDAEAIYGEILSVGEHATPQDVVKKAKLKKSAMHHCFEWDNEIAGDNWRFHQARRLIAAIVIYDKPETEGIEPVIMRAFENVTIDSDSNTRGYVTREQVIVNPDYLEEVKAEIVSAIDDFTKHLNTYKDVHGMERTVQRIVDRVGSAKELIFT